MKFRILLLLLLSFYTFSHAQNKGTNHKREFGPYEKCWQIRLTTGTNIDLSHSGSDPYSTLLGSRPTVAPLLNFRIAHLFSKRIGWYADFQMNFYKDKKAKYLQSDIIGDIFEDYFNRLFWPASVIHPSLDAGIVYRIEKNRWNIYPELGLGYTSYLADRNSTKTVSNADGQKGVDYKQSASGLFLKTGVSIDYYISRKSYLIFQVNYQQPLQKSHAELTYTTDGIETDKISYRSSSIGQNLNLGLGFGFTFGRK